VSRRGRLFLQRSSLYSSLLYGSATEGSAEMISRDTVAIDPASATGQREALAGPALAAAGSVRPKPWVLRTTTAHVRATVFRGGSCAGSFVGHTSSLGDYSARARADSRWRFARIEWRSRRFAAKSLLCFNALRDSRWSREISESPCSTCSMHASLEASTSPI